MSKRSTLLCGLSIKVKTAEYRRCMSHGGALEFCFHHCPSREFHENVEACPHFKRYLQNHIRKGLALDSHIYEHLKG